MGRGPDRLRGAGEKAAQRAKLAQLVPCPEPGWCLRSPDRPRGWRPLADAGVKQAQEGSLGAEFRQLRGTKFES